ncbi:AzlC family ABC transporter permease [Fundicoccus culcitae]|uniref:AzlC family ABC transporter permease n=1 Tax=Fundicoccus culcitae TaxID=2969821 RepID=A0ABY5P922_9LACT|nr:AzlC family ABC transporter permease [Fundicoccus culcitae]UUX34970.1 AzlC family ABC transporter permease [Fundicoccus culcitae]
MKEAFKFVFPKTIPIMTGYLFLGIAYGFLITSQGYDVWIPIAMSLFIYAGSMQYAAIPLLAAPFDPLGAFILTLMVNARHVFYAIALLRQYHDMGWQKWYSIFALSDETFSLNISMEIPEDINPSWAYFHVSWLDHFYWVAATALGALLGSFLTFDTTGIEFVLTALFLSIFVERWLNTNDHRAAMVGVVAPVICLIIFGPANFMIPAMFLILLIFAIEYYQKERRHD